MLKIGILGTGGMAAARAEAFAGNSRTKLAFICSRSLEKTVALCKATGAEGVDDFGCALHKADAVVLCVPNQRHTTYALQALKAGKHVLVEYPLCTDRSDIERLRETASEAGVVLMVGNTIIHETMFRWIMDHRSALGSLTSASSRTAFYGSEIAGSWYLQPGMIGSCFSSYHYHHIEYYRRLLGEVTWVHANDESQPDAEHPGCLSIAGGTLLMGHETGATSCIQWYLSRTGSGLARGLWLNGTDGTLTILSEAESEDACRAIWETPGGQKSESFTTDWGIQGSCNDFTDAIHGNLDHHLRLASDIETLAVGLAAAESSQLRTPVPLS